MASGIDQHHRHHGHAHTHTRTNERHTPTVRSIQLDFKHALGRRFQRLRGVVRATVGYENDALHLSTRTNDADDIDARESFPFGTTTSKQIAFREQLRQWLEEGVLEPVGEQSTTGEHYTAEYVRRSYAKGVEWADQRMTEQGLDPIDTGDMQLVFNRPIHRDQLEALYTRDFTNLQDITTDVDESLSRLLTEGLRDGWNPNRMAARMTEEIRDIERTRARVLARTEVMHSHNRAAEARYRERGVSRVEIIATEPCELCDPFDGKQYPLDEMPLGGPPFHPNCRCSTLPVLN